MDRILGSRGPRQTPLDWDNRMRIALAARHSLAYLNSAAKLVHENVKATNVLLRPDPDAIAVFDYGLSPLFGTAALPNQVAGYHGCQLRLCIDDQVLIADFDHGVIDPNSGR
ncbi:hypothetical protein Taro_028509 [Colocasia esculenta]|uniref:Protein kinase domain-containing protein n=1 Tax=Colocasia esculenta TaxID=4460 RepID=A0A843VUE2_COLES|nr:hypothetical protein [Colocasia esculenta]